LLLSCLMAARRNVVEIVSGIFVLLLGVFLLVYAYKQSNWRAHESYLLKADFDSVDGLKPGDLVKLRGVVVGSVSSIDLDQKKLTGIVSFQIYKEVQLSDDSSAAITSEGLLGGKSLSLVPGSEQQKLKPGDVIYKTQPGVSLESLLQKFVFSGDKGDKSTDKSDEVGSKRVAGQASQKEAVPGSVGGPTAVEQK